MKVKTDWTSDDYLDVYVTNNNELLDVLNEDKDTINLNNHAIIRIINNCQSSCILLYNSLGLTVTCDLPDTSQISFEQIITANDMNKIETAVKTLSNITSQQYTKKTWTNATPITSEDLNRIEKPFLLLNSYEESYNAGDGLKPRYCGTFYCGDSIATFGG